MKARWFITGFCSLPLLLSADSLPVITTHPQNQVIAPGSEAILSLESTNATTYQWRFNGGDIPWGTNATLTVTNAQSTSIGYYMAVAKNEMGWTPSQLAYLSVTESGGTVPFSNIGIPFAVASYQCCCGVDGPITNGTVRIVAGPELDQMGPVGNWGTVSNGYFDYPPVHVPNAAAGQTVYYRVDITWTAGLCSQPFWQPSTTLKLAAGGNGYPTPSADALYFHGFLEWPIPSIWPFDCTTGTGEQSNTNQILIPGEFGRLFACPDGYMWGVKAEWRKDGALIEGATNKNLMITNFQTSDVGVYDVQAFSPIGGAAISSKFFLSIQTAIGQGVFVKPRVSQSSFIADFEGVPMRRYRILCSSNLTDWLNLMTLTNTTGTAVFTNSITGNGPRYYRAMLLP